MLTGTAHMKGKVKWKNKLAIILGYDILFPELFQGGQNTWRKKTKNLL